MRISIVVACRNEVAHIRPFLDSLLAQDMGGIEWEVLIADGMSDDGTREIVAGYAARDARLRLIENPRRIVSAGLNLAIRASRGDIICRLDAHTRYAPDYCRRCLETLERTCADNVGGPARTTARGTLPRAIAAAYHSRFSTGGARFHDDGYEGWVDTVPYGCWRKSTLERIGLFDERMVRNQDDELNLRLLRAGGRIWQSPQIVSWYSPRSTLAGLFGQYFQYGFWKTAVIRKHRIPGSWRQLVPCVFLAANLLLPAGIVAALVARHEQAAYLCAAAWCVMVSLYAGASLSASVNAARRHGWRILPYLPPVFATYHLSYGLGFLAGLFSELAGFSRALGSSPLFTRITR